MSFWTDSKVDDDFTPEEKYFFLYLLTNPHTNLCGCYEISMKQMVRETGYNEDTVRRLIDRMENVHKVIAYDKDTKEIYIPNWGKYNWANSPKTLQGAMNVASNIKSERFKKALADTLSIGYPYPMDTSVTVSNNIPVNNKRFIKPTLEEVTAYCDERDNEVDPQTFLDFYEMKGWKVGKETMKDWKAAVRTWERRNASQDEIADRHYEKLRRQIEKESNK